MTVYMYYQEMQELCARASNAFSVCEDGKSPLADVYSMAEQGFYNKICSLPVEEANKFCSPQREARLNDLKHFVEDKEDAAAWHQKTKETKNTAKN